VLIDLLDTTADSRVALPALVSRQGRRLARVRRPPEPVRAQGWREWCRELFPGRYGAPFGDFHVRMWEHSELIDEETVPPPYAAIWPRGFGKTGTMEGIIAKTLAERRRRFWVIACHDLGKAQDRVDAIRRELEGDDFRRRYPLVGEPATTRRGVLRAWGNELLITASGQIVQAASMGAEVRGLAHAVDGEMLRPDALWIDDPDKMHDSEHVTKKKVDQVRRALVPLQGRRRMAVFFTQTITNPTGVAAGIVANSVGFARDRVLDGPIGAVVGLETEAVVEQGQDIDGNPVPVTRHVITAGRARWEGLPIEECQRLINEMGLEAFEEEMMNRFRQRKGALLTLADFVYASPDFNPEQVQRRVVAVDPSGGAVEHGIMVVGASQVLIGDVWREVFYVLEDLTVPGSEDWTPVAILAGQRWKCDVLYEANGVGGGAGLTLDYAADDLRRRGLLTGPTPAFNSVPAVFSKEDRAMPAQRAHREARVIYCGTFPKLVREWTTWVPAVVGSRGRKSPNRIDAEAHGVNFLSTEASGLVAEFAP